MFTLIDRYWYYLRPPTKNENSGRNIELIKEEKYTTLNFGLLGKFLTHIFLLITVHIIVFWVIPNIANDENILHPECDYESRIDQTCGETNTNIYILGFYLIYCLYFLISAAQIRFGWPESDESQILKSAGKTSKYLLYVFFAIPFLWEVKAIKAWLWTKTSFGIYRWIKFEEMYANLFIAKCNAKARAEKGEGKETDKTYKTIVGGCRLRMG